MFLRFFLWPPYDTFILRAQIASLTALRKKILYSFLHGLLVTGLVWIYVNTWYTLGIEEGLVKNLLTVRHILFPNKEFPPGEVLLINTSKDISVVSDPNEYGKVAITDRATLLRFFSLIDSLHIRPKFILCDLLFDIKTPLDKELQDKLGRTRNIIIPYTSYEDRLTDPIFKIPKGVGQYMTNSGSFIKLRLMQEDSLKSIPVVMDELLNGRSYERKGIFTYCDHRVSLNYIIPGFYLRPFQVFKENKYHLVNLGELADTTMDAEMLRNELEDKWLVIGNFYDDVHETSLGKMPGSLILFNSYLSLVYGNHIVSVGWVLFLVVSFSFLSYTAFYRRMPKLKMPWKAPIYRHLESFLSKYVSFFGMVFLLSLCSFFLFNIHVNILVVSFYFSMINFIAQKNKDEKVE